MPFVRFAPFVLTALVAAGCAQGAASTDEAPVVAARPLAALTAQRIVVAPVPAVVEGDPLGWGAGIPRQREWLRQLDSAIATELGQRGLATAWVYAGALGRAYERNSALSPDPYRLASGPLRGLSRLSGSERVPEPLASQLRTLVAVHDGRFVLLPLDVAFEAAPGSAGGQARLKLLLIDARTTEIRWIGEVRSDPSSTLTPAVTSSLASHLADLIAAR